MKRALPVLAFSCAALALSSCSTTSLVAKWKDPATTELQFQKVLVVAQSADDSLRRSVEDGLVRRIPGAVPSYTLLSADEVRNVSTAKAKVAAGGFDGAVVVRLVGVDNELSYVPGSLWVDPGYGSFWGYYPMGWNAVYDPGYLREDKVVTLETLVYDVPQDKLVWASRSETMNPESVESLMGSVTGAVAKEMRKQKLIS